MAQSRQSTENAQRMMRDLLAAEHLAASLAATAPRAIAKAGGAQFLVAQYGNPTGALYWSIKPMSELLWTQMAEEHQAKHRSNIGAS